MRVACSIMPIVLEGDHGGDVDSVEATCSRCEHITESFGAGEASIKRCLVLMREECPNDEKNFYYDDEEDD